MDDIKDYLLSLKQWCADEGKVWEAHRRERETSRIEVRQEEAQVRARRGGAAAQRAST